LFTEDRARTNTLGFANSVSACGTGISRDVSPLLVVTESPKRCHPTAYSHTA